MHRLETVLDWFARGSTCFRRNTEQRLPADTLCFFSFLHLKQREKGKQPSEGSHSRTHNWSATKFSRRRAKGRRGILSLIKAHKVSHEGDRVEKKGKVMPALEKNRNRKGFACGEGRCGSIKLIKRLFFHKVPVLQSVCGSSPFNEESIAVPAASERCCCSLAIRATSCSCERLCFGGKKAVH